MVEHALTLDPLALLDLSNVLCVGKRPLRQLYDRYPAALPAAIRDRGKAPFNEGCGFDAADDRSPWIDLAEELVSDAAFADGRRAFADFHVRTKEEYFYISLLSEVIDIRRTPHLTGRTWLVAPSGFLEDQGATAACWT